MTPRARFWSKEKAYWEALPLASFTWMSVLVLGSLCVNPLLPITAYALQLWASAWNWRDRWASIRTLATPGIVFVCCLLILALLDHAHVWIIPSLVGSVQRFWQTHLPGDLSLSPLDLHALVARLVLLLPLAPGLALLSESIAPRTRTQSRRILLQRDLVPAPLPPAASHTAPGPATAPKSESHAPVPLAQPAPSFAKKSAPAAKQQQPLHRKQQPSGAPPAASTVEQMTIDSFLAPDTSDAPVQQPTETKATQQPPQQATSPETPIDWDNVLE